MLRDVLVCLDRLQPDLVARFHQKPWELERPVYGITAAQDRATQQAEKAPLAPWKTAVAALRTAARRHRPLAPATSARHPQQNPMHREAGGAVGTVPADPAAEPHPPEGPALRRETEFPPLPRSQRQNPLYQCCRSMIRRPLAPLGRATPPPRQHPMHREQPEAARTPRARALYAALEPHLCSAEASRRTLPIRHLPPNRSCSRASPGQAGARRPHPAATLRKVEATPHAP